MVLNIDNTIKNTCMIKKSTSNSNTNIEDVKNNEDIKNEDIKNEDIKNEDIKNEENENINKALEKDIENDKNNFKKENHEIIESKKVNNNDSLEEIDLEVSNTSEEFSLKNPIEVYTEIYNKAKDKAKQLKLAAITAFLEAREIKNKYDLEESDISDNELFNNE